MPRNEDKTNRQGPKGSDELPDFGAFVSRSVQQTANKLKGDQGESQEPSRPAINVRPDGNRTLERARDAEYWRRKAADAGIQIEDEGEDFPPPVQNRPRRNRYLPAGDADVDQFHDENEFDHRGGFGGFGGFFTDFLSGDGEDRNRNRIIVAVAALLVLLLIIWGVTRLMGDDNKGDGGVGTPAPTEVVDGVATPGSGPTDLVTTETVVPEETPQPEIPRGGDNQRGESGSPPEAQSTEIAAADLTSEVARACSGLCLVRVEGSDQDKAYDEASARASWAEGDVSWVVVNPTQAEILDRDLNLTFIENDPRTYDLYVVKPTAEHNQRDVVTPNGEIIDETDSLYLVRWFSVPAIVKPVTDWGYGVYKIAPAPPTTIAQLGTMGPANQTNGWALMEQVDQGNIERIINDLTHVGELDGSGLGTRFYRFPGNQIAADYLFQELESYGLTVWYEDFLMWDGTLLVNVVAEIPGNDDSEVYAIMAHLDSTNLSNFRVAPGADDNSSGLAATLETARILAGYELEHPVRIALVNAEEEGIYGSMYWAKEANRNQVPIAGVFNVDSVGSVRNRAVVITNAQGESVWMQQHLSRINEEYGLQEIFNHHQSDAIVADDTFVRAEGIPSVMLARELYGQTKIHHSVDDVIENVSIGGIVDMTNLVMVSVWDLVQ